MKKSIKEGLLDRLRKAISQRIDKDYHKKVEKILDTDDTPPDVLKKIAKAQSEIDSAISDFERAIGKKI